MTAVWLIYVKKKSRWLISNTKQMLIESIFLGYIGQLYVYRVAKFSPKVCSWLTTKVADVVVPARFLEKILIFYYCVCALV